MTIHNIVWLSFSLLVSNIYFTPRIVEFDIIDFDVWKNLGGVPKFYLSFFSLKLPARWFPSGAPPLDMFAGSYYVSYIIFFMNQC